MVSWGIFNGITRIEMFVTRGPWWWRPVGGAITLGVMIAIYLALG